MTVTRLFYGVPSVEKAVIGPHECPEFLMAAVIDDLQDRYGEVPKEIFRQDEMNLDIGGMKLMGAEKVVINFPEYRVSVDLDMIPPVVAYLQYGLTKESSMLGGHRVVKLHRFHHTIVVLPMHDLPPLIAELLPHVDRAAADFNKRAEALEAGGLVHVHKRTPLKKVSE